MAKSIRSRVYDELRMWPKDSATGMPFAEGDEYGSYTVNRLLRLLFDLHDDYVRLEYELENDHKNDTKN